MLANNEAMSIVQHSFVVNDSHTDDIMLHVNSGISYERNSLVNHVTTKYVALVEDYHMLPNKASLDAHGVRIIGLSLVIA